MRGFTLPEVLVGGVLLLAVLGCSLALFVPTLGAYRFSQSRLEVRQSALQALNRLNHSIENSISDSMTLLPATATQGVMLSSVEVVDFSASGNSRYGDRFDVFYHDKSAEKLLWRRVAPVGADFTQDAPPHVLPSDLPGLATAGAGELRVVSMYVTNCTIESASPGSSSLTFPLRLSLTTCVPREDVQRPHWESYTLRSTAAPLSRRW